MTDFSRDPGDVLADNLAQGYVGMYFQQGVPLLDRDLNLQQDLLASAMRSIVGGFLGSGVAPLLSAGGVAQRGDAFLVTETADASVTNDFVVTPGTALPGRALVNGIEVTIKDARRYSAQLGLGALSPPAAGSPTRTDLVYLDAFLQTDESGAVMANPLDVVVQTSVRLRPAWLAKVAVGETDLPTPDPGHAHLPLAKLTRAAAQQRITAAAITDLRPHLFSLADLRRLLIDPVVLDSTPIAAKQGESITVRGRNLQFLPGEKVTVVIGTAAPLVIEGGKLTPGTLQIVVPSFGLTPASPPLNTALTVLTPYGSTQVAFRVLPPQ